jgi:hypothetical protein
MGIGGFCRNLLHFPHVVTGIGIGYGGRHVGLGLFNRHLMPLMR